MYIFYYNFFYYKIFYPFKFTIESAKVKLYTRYNNIKRASPIDISLPAIANTNIMYVNPKMSSKKIDAKKKFKLHDINKISNDINNKKLFFLAIIRPISPIKKTTTENKK